MIPLVIPVFALMILVFIAVGALLRLLRPELYIVSLIGLSMLAFSILRTNKGMYIGIMLVTYILICLSWGLASHFQSLPRDDVYHYYPFTKYVYTVGHFTYPGKEEVLEKIFLGIVVPWPAWHIVVASITHILGLPLFYVVQIVQAMTTGPLVLLSSILLAKAIIVEFDEILQKNFLKVLYVGAMFIPFLSFYVYANTNPVSRSFASALYVMLTYIIIRIWLRGVTADFVVAALLLLCMVFAHPYWCLATPLTVALIPIIASILFKVCRIDTYRGRSLSRASLLGLMALLTSIAWILYYTYTARTSLINAIDTLISMKWRDILGISVAKPWLETRAVETVFFRVHPLEHIVYWMVWATDLIPVALAIIGLTMLILLPMLKRKYVNPMHVFIVSIIAASAAVLLLTGMASSGLITRYAIKLAYVPLCVVAMLMLAKHGHALMKAKLLNAVLASLILIYVLTAGLSLGTRTYQAPFIWSSTITFEDKGMHTTHAEPLTEFCNKYCKYNSYNYLLTDDVITRVFMPLRVFMEFTEKQGSMAPQSFTQILHRNIHNALILSVRDFKPTYWALRSWTWYGIDIPRLVEQAKSVILSNSSILYQDTLGNKVYVLIRITHP